MLPFLCHDIVFKSVFSGNENILAKLLASITGVDYEVFHDNIIFKTNELPISSKNEKAKRCNFIVEITPDNIINIEINGNYYKGMRTKNLTYIFDIFTKHTKRGCEYKDNFIITGINIDCFRGGDNIEGEPLMEFVLSSPEKKKIPDYIKWGAFLSLDDFSLIPDIMEGILTDEEVINIMDNIDKLSHDDYFMSQVEAMKWEE